MIAAEEKQLVLPERSTEGTAELVLPQDLFLRLIGAAVAVVEEVVGIERFVAEELEERAMELVGSGLHDEVHVRAGISSIARIVCGSLYLELLDRVGVGDSESGINSKIGRRVGAAGGIHDGRAVHLVIVLVWPRAVDAHVGGAFAERRAVEQIRRHAGRQAQNLRIIAAGERKVRDIPPRDDGTQCGACCLQNLGGSLNLNDFALPADLHDVIQHRRGFDVDRYGRDLGRLESRIRELDAIGSRRE